MTCVHLEVRTFVKNIKKLTVLIDFKAENQNGKGR